MEKCQIVEDLLPLYVEGLASEESQKFVEDHLKVCPKCREALSDLKKGPALPKEEDRGLKKVRSGLKKRKKKILALALVFCLLACSLLFQYMSQRTYLGSEDLDLEQMDNRLVLKFSPKVGNYTLEKTREDGKINYQLSIWTSPLDRLLKGGGKEASVLLEERASQIGKLYLVNYRGGEDLLLYGPHENGGQLTLPRLAWKAYLALDLLIFLATTALLYGRKREGKGLKVLWGLSLSYLLAHGIFFLGRGPVYDLSLYLGKMGVYTLLIFLELLIVKKLKEDF